MSVYTVHSELNFTSMVTCASFWTHTDTSGNLHVCDTEGWMESLGLFVGGLPNCCPCTMSPTRFFGPQMFVYNKIEKEKQGKSVLG